MSNRKCKQIIEAKSAPIASEIQLTGECTIEAAASDTNANPKFSMVAYTGGALRVRGWNHPVVIDLKGVRTVTPKIPARFQHDATRGVGHVESVTVRDGQIIANGVVSRDTPEAREVVSSGAKGFPWQVSLGAIPGKVDLIKAGQSVAVNDKVFNGPVYVSRDTPIHEMSFVDYGADVFTSALIHASGMENVMDFDAWLTANGFEAQDKLGAKQLKALKAAFDAEQDDDTPAPKRKTKRKSITAGGGDDDDEGDDSPETIRADAGDPLEGEFAAAELKIKRQRAYRKIVAAALIDNPGIVASVRELTDTAIEANWTPQEFELAMLRLTRNTRTTNIRRGNCESAIPSSQIFEAGLCMSAGLGNLEKQFEASALEQANRRWKHGLTIGELLCEAAECNDGERIRSFRSHMDKAIRAAFNGGRIVEASGMSGIDISGILGNVANKFIRESFNAVEQTWQSVSAVRPVTDFKQITTYSLVDDSQYEEVAPGGELKHGRLGQISYTNQAKTFGKIYGLDRRDLVNDDLGVFRAMGKRLGRGGALKFNDVFWRAFMDNSAFFTTALGNLDEGTDTALGIDSLQLAYNLFTSLKNPRVGDEPETPVGHKPRILLVPNALLVKADNLMKSTELRDTTASTKYVVNNPWAGKFTTVMSSYLANAAYTGNSALKWYLLADPNDVPVIESVFLNGKREPTVESADADFNQLGIQFRGYHDFGVTKQEYRGGVAMKGEN